MARSVLLVNNDIFADGVSLKRACSVMSTRISEDYGVDIPHSKLLDMTAVSWGYLSYHDMRQAATVAQTQPPTRMRKDFRLLKPHWTSRLHG